MAPDPFAQDARIVRQLPGLSGARVLLMTNDDCRWFVRKIAHDSSGSERLARQIRKQVAFVRAMSSMVRAPAILEQGVIEGRAYVDMEFVRGTDGATYLSRAGHEDVVAFADTLCGYIKAVAERPAHQAASGSMFDALFGKVCEVQRKTGLLDNDTLARMFTALDRVRLASGALATTLCHGDLTLENLIVDEQRRVWVLDLLDAPYEHYWQDVAKLHQDLEGGWYLLGRPAISRYVLDFLSSKVVAAAVSLDPAYAEVHAVLLACTFIRILPYARSEHERAFVQQRVRHFARLAHGASL